MSLIEEMEQGWLDHDKEFRVRLASVTDYIGPEFTTGLFAALEIVFILGGADMLRVLVHRNMLNDDILTGREAIKYTTLCRLSTGGGFAVRQLYTDQDEVLFDAVRPVILNGIEDIAARPDLTDRAIFLTLESIPEERRRPEAELWAAFETERRTGLHRKCRQMNTPVFLTALSRTSLLFWKCREPMTWGQACALYASLGGFYELAQFGYAGDVNVSLIRFGGHLSKGEYDGHHGRQPGAADAAELHGRLQDRRGAPGPR